MQEGSSSLYYMRSRYYDRVTARFISRDQVKSFGPKSINPYQYALGNPLKYRDPLGLDPAELMEAQRQAGRTSYGEDRVEWLWTHGETPESKELAIDLAVKQGKTVVLIWWQKGRNMGHASVWIDPQTYVSFWPRPRGALWTSGAVA